MTINEINETLEGVEKLNSDVRSELLFTITKCIWELNKPLTDAYRDGVSICDIGVIIDLLIKDQIVDNLKKFYCKREVE
ncbi:MAG: hypothetical protein V1649_00270 [Patescibacteria group bacterium]